MDIQKKLNPNEPQMTSEESFKKRNNKENLERQERNNPAPEQQKPQKVVPLRQPAATHKQPVNDNRPQAGTSKPDKSIYTYFNNRPGGNSPVGDIINGTVGVAADAAIKKMGAGINKVYTKVFGERITASYQRGQRLPANSNMKPLNTEKQTTARRAPSAAEKSPAPNDSMADIDRKLKSTPAPSPEREKDMGPQLG